MGKVVFAGGIVGWKLDILPNGVEFKEAGEETPTEGSVCEHNNKIRASVHNYIYATLKS
ncbi:hypothetical protein HanRHA438_Chr08g0328631 [Helianthus annuus]|nr:hypothetical protein HanRHA438_Chr08g0328631 [Helianthus annuus]